MSKLRENKLRLFFALWPGTAGRAALAQWQPPLQERCGGKAMQASTLHCTLVFLGEVAEHRLEALKLAAQEATFRPFRLELTGGRYWGHNHIVYAAPDRTPPPLAELVRTLESGLHRHRFRFEQRPYKPHVTLLRNAQWSDRPLPAMEKVRWQVQRFALVQSLSGAKGAYYRVLAHFGAAGAE
ncbi:MAG: RNA 2',3'-cyclic phosphodiesterase [Gammaproteobacteria bacterium]|nr:RNA 2',3'-cyclic phosphodiesterase [Gammaproteobacteria bacterium]MBU1776150.1 RNA 2',3'-cyclic phosphodiesterase [Gammaproteobacteria bacterium]